MNISQLQQVVNQFRDERDWKQFHNPKDLAQAISIESSELLEHFLWVSQDESVKVAKEMKEEIADEMADVLAYLLSLSDITGIELDKALVNKMKKNEEKYPISKAKGNSKKYTKE